jgi:iron complex outermembrane receptor protein
VHRLPFCYFPAAFPLLYQLCSLRGRWLRGKIMQSKSISTIGAIALAMATQAFAQEDSVVVTATRFPERKLEHPIGVTVVTREQIANSSAANLPDLLSRYAGINTRNNAGSPDVAIDLRGFGASGDQNTLVLLDGQRLNDIELTTVRWSAIPLEAIERVEIQRGGGAVMYGGGATGGTINIITRSSIAGDRSATVAASAGTYNSNDLRASVNIAGDSTGFALTASQHNSDGYRDNNRLEQGNLLGDLRWSGNRAGLVFKFGLDNQSLRLPGARTAVQLGTDPRGTATPNDYSARDGKQATLSGRYAFEAAELALDLSYRDTRRVAFFDDYSGLGFSTFTDTHASVWALTPRLKTPYRFLGRDHVLIFGMDADIWDYQALRASRFERLGAPQVDLAATQKDRAYYVQHHTAFGTATKLTLGARLQRVDISANDRVNPASYASAAMARSPRAWEMALRHNLNPTLALFGKLGASFRVASVDEIYNQFGGPAFDSIVMPLEPQTSRDSEIGAEYKSGAGRLQARIYRMDLRNEIHFNAINFTNMNLSPTQREGFELEGSRTLGKRVDLFASYTQARAVFREGVYNGFDATFAPIRVDLAGKQVPLVPRNSAKLGLGWQFAAKTRLSGALGYVGKQYFDNDQANTFPGQMASFVTADAKLSHAAGPWTFTLVGNNLTDRKYYTYAIRNAAGSSFNAYPMAGRNVLLTAAYRFQ